MIFDHVKNTYLEMTEIMHIRTVSKDWLFEDIFLVESNIESRVIFPKFICKCLRCKFDKSLVSNFCPQMSDRRVICAIFQRNIQLGKLAKNLASNKLRFNTI